MDNRGKSDCQKQNRRQQQQSEHKMIGMIHRTEPFQWRSISSTARSAA